MLKPHTRRETQLHTCQPRWHTNKHVIIIMPKGGELLVASSQDIVSHAARQAGIRGEADRRGGIE